MSKETEQPKNQLAQDIIMVHVGSFPLSPGVLTGHSDIFELYRIHYENKLKGKSLKSVLGPNPKAPKIIIPAGHTPLFSFDMTNQSIWERGIERLFSNAPTRPQEEIIQSLVYTNARSDNANFDRRLQGNKSQLVGSPRQTPSLLKAFVFDGHFPYKNDFFNWTLEEMAKQVRHALTEKGDELWIHEVQVLAKTWKTKYPRIPFAP